MTTEELKKKKGKGKERKAQVDSLCPLCQLRQGDAGEVITGGPPLGMVATAFHKEPVSAAAQPSQSRDSHPAEIPDVLPRPRLFVLNSEEKSGLR